MKIQDGVTLILGENQTLKDWFGKKIAQKPEGDSAARPNIKNLRAEYEFGFGVDGKEVPRASYDTRPSVVILYERGPDLHYFAAPTQSTRS